MVLSPSLFLSLLKSAIIRCFKATAIRIKQTQSINDLNTSQHSANLTSDPHLRSIRNTTQQIASNSTTMQVNMRLPPTSLQRSVQRLNPFGMNFNTLHSRYLLQLSVELPVQFKMRQLVWRKESERQWSLRSRLWGIDIASDTMLRVCPTGQYISAVRFTIKRGRSSIKCMAYYKIEFNHGVMTTQWLIDQQQKQQNQYLISVTPSQFHMRTLTKLVWRMSTNKRCHYEVLGLPKTATLDQIKKAYYKLAQKYHPDKNPDDPKAKQIFSEINSSYEILSDEGKKRTYDSQSNPSAAGGRGFRASNFTGQGPVDPFAEYSQDFFKEKGSGFYEGFSQGSRRARGQDITRIVELQFADAARGKQISMQYQKISICGSCQGTKCKPGTAPTRCMSCGGSGTTTLRQGGIVMHIPCSKCQGVGLYIKNPCTVCKASGVMKNTVTQNISAPAGVANGQTVTFPGKGNKGQGGQDGDLHVQFSVKPHSKFRRKGNDIQSTEFLTISQAVLGHKSSVETLFGNKEVTFPAGCQDGQRITLRSYGIHRSQGVGTTKGDHIVIARVKIPKQLTPEQKKLFVQISKTQQRVDGSRQPEPQDKQRVFDRFKNMFK